MKFSNREFGILLIFLFLLNCIDAYATLYWITHNHASEINPIMNGWLSIGGQAFLYVKICVVSMACFFLWKGRKNKLAYILVSLVSLLYLFVLVLHFNIFLNVFIL